MSSTNRSNLRNKHIADYYVTPLDDVRVFVDKFSEVSGTEWKWNIVLDPCAGGNEKTENDAYHPMSYPSVLKEYGCDVRTIDIREDSLADVKADYLAYKIDCKPDIIITNPPFNIATKIIEKALNDVVDNGYVIMLLRLNFFGSKEREQFFSMYMPEYVFVHHVRMSFTDKKVDGKVVYDKDGNPKRGGTDSIEYCHMVFRKGYKPDFSRLYYI